MTALGGDQTAQLFAKMFTGHRLAAAAMGGDALECTVVSATATTVTFTVDGFDSTGQSTFTGDYEPRFTWTAGTKAQVTPPVGTRCIAIWPANSTSGTPIVTTFLGWPT